jgi:hypothetical protein
MPKTLDDSDLQSLLQPVKLESFTVSPERGSRSTFSGIPKIEKSKMWDFSIGEDGSGNRVLSFLVNNRTINFRLSHSDKPEQPIDAIRLPDSETEDFGISGDNRTGRAQIHRSGPNSIVGTFQTGKNNMTFEFQKNESGDQDWRVFPRKNPNANVKTFVNAITGKRASDLDSVLKDLESSTVSTAVTGAPRSLFDAIKKFRVPIPSVDTVTYPLTGPALRAIPIAGGIGAGAMGLRNMFQRATGQEHNSLLLDLLLGGGVGAGASGAFKLFGQHNSPGKTPYETQMYSKNMKPQNSILFPTELATNKSYWDVIRDLPERKTAQQDNVPISKHNKKVAFGTGNQEVDLIALQSILGADPTLTQGDRNILIGQARTAMRSTGQTSVPVNSIRGMGLGMLAGYAISKFFGFGGLGTIASVAIGGGFGRMGGGSGPTWNSKGYYVY